jgi:nicotinamide riboside kinase
MLRINYYGGPGVGKSTLAACTYAELNRSGKITAELVREFIKDWAYEGRQPDGWDQVFTFASQLYAEHRLAKAGVKVVVTDSPVILQCVYASMKDAIIGSHLVNLATAYEQAHTSLNFFVERCVAYDPSGRFQTPGALADVDHRIEAYLGHLHVRYVRVVPSDWDTIIETVKEAVYSQTK